MAFAGVANAAVTLSATLPWGVHTVTAPNVDLFRPYVVEFMAKGSPATCNIDQYELHGGDLNNTISLPANKSFDAYCRGPVGSQDSPNYMIYAAHCWKNPADLAGRSNWYEKSNCESIQVISDGSSNLNSEVSVTIPSTSIGLPTDGSPTLLIGDIVTSGNQGYYRSGVIITGDSELTGVNTGKKIPLVFKDKNGTVITRNGTSLDVGPDTTISANFEGAAGDRYVANLVVTVTLY